MYPYLTGSASWYLLTLLTEVFGVKGILGNLALSPKLVQSQFNAEGNAQVVTLFAGRKLTVVYHNPSRLDYGDYRIKEIRIDGKIVPFDWLEDTAILSRAVIAGLDAQQTHQIEASLT
jgi:cellobiose phosphorylase